ncbi:MAG: hypothetical protein IJE09_01930 [Oscillospiraceae bacterium]|nr:hypothetical protein [Oscillospiraceae bacterium]
MLSFCLVPTKSFSESERRLLQQTPEISLESIMDGSFMDEFEAFAQDQFPLRDSFRGLKSQFALKLLQQGDNNGLYISAGHISKLDGPLNEKMLDHAAGRFESIYAKYLKDTSCRVWFSMIPDKNYFIAPEAGRPYLDFEELESYMLKKADYMQYIPIAQLLETGDYYRSDSHWRQERIEDIAETICKAMGTANLGEHEIVPVLQDFHGVYSGQLANSSISDRIFYATNDTIRACTVTSYDSGSPKAVPFYDMEAATGRDPYEMFLNGADALLVIENHSANTGRELIIFRDSFGSSLAPLLIESYDKITLVDIRYIQSAMLDQFISFDKQDVLFIYSSGLLNNSMALK